MQESMSLKYEPALLPQHISVKWLFLHEVGQEPGLRGRECEMAMLASLCRIEGVSLYHIYISLPRMSCNARKSWTNVPLQRGRNTANELCVTSPEVVVKAGLHGRECKVATLASLCRIEGVVLHHMYISLSRRSCDARKG